MSIKRRHFLYFLGASLTTTTLGSCQRNPGGSNTAATLAPAPEAAGATTGLGFQPVQGPMPLEYMPVKGVEQSAAYAFYEVQDDIVLPEGFTYDAIAVWGDPLGDVTRVGYNNDYLSFVATGENEGFLTANFEYISGKPWMQSYEQVIGGILPFAEVIASLKPTKGKIDAYTLADDNPLKAQIQEISRAALGDQGIGVMFLRRNAEGIWQRESSVGDRRISGISGFVGNFVKSTGPATAIFRKAGKLGFEDGLGDSIVGTFGNCAGGTTPWGTVLSAEENFQDQVAEPVYPDGSSFSPSALPFEIDDYSIGGQGNVLGLAGNKYGYMVEVDPTNPQDYGTKHTWLGRYRHEAVAVRAVSGKPLAVYSGCDRRSGHVYKFVSDAPVGDPTDKANSQLMQSGMLYAAVFNPDGTGQWIPLKADTPVNPVLPSAVHGQTVMLPRRPDGGVVAVRADAEAIAFKEQFPTLGDLYVGTPEEKQGAILIDAHYAANAAGATCTARPEDTELDAEGTLYVSFTSGTPSHSDGGPDKQVFSGPNGEVWEYGWIFRLEEDNADPAAMTFRWDKLAMGGEPAKGGAGFSNPDNLLIDENRNVWMVTDMSTSNHNDPTDENRLGNFGNNSIWFIPTSGEDAGNAYLFGMGPMECEMTGPFFSPDRRTLFIAVQHPGEASGMRVDGATDTREFNLLATDGTEFRQKRQIPAGSNWPTKGVNEPPKPAIVAIRRLDNQPIA